MKAKYSSGLHQSLKISFLSVAVLGLTACGNDDGTDDIERHAKVSQPKTVELRVMETTDLHAYLMNHNYFTNSQDDSVGFVKTASLIKEAREEATNSVLVDNGDLIQGSPLGDYMAKIKGLENNEVHPIYKAMNLLDYDVANIGNHEFNYGLHFLKESIDDANFPYISANVFFDDHDDDDSNDTHYFTPYIIKSKNVLDTQGNAHTLDIGYIGFVPPQIMNWDQAHLEGKLKAKDIVDMAVKYVPQMKAEGADIIIAIPHSGLTSDTRKKNAENASYYLSEIEGIDAILFGHAHQNFPSEAYENVSGVNIEKGTINGVAAVMPGFWGNNLGYIDMTLSVTELGDWSVIDTQSVLKPIANRNEDRSYTPLVESHMGVKEAISHDHQAVVDWVSEPFAKIFAPINSFFALTQDDPSIQVVTDAQRWYTETLIKGTELEGMPILSVGAPFRAGGRQGPDNYTNLAAGDVAYGNVSDLYIYPNTLKVLKLTGADVKEWLEMSSGQFNQINVGSLNSDLINTEFPSYNFDVIDGVTYEIDVSQPAKYSSKGDIANAGSQRIVNLKFNGEAIDPAQSFLVVSNNYRAGGGGNFPGVTAEKIVIDAPNENRQVVADYLIAQTQLNPTTGFDPSADGNWTFTSLPNTVVKFIGSPSDTAKDFASNNLPAVNYVQNDTEGFGIYTLDMN